MQMRIRVTPRKIILLLSKNIYVNRDRAVAKYRPFLAGGDWCVFVKI
jgi:hypothetical protein